MDNEKTIMCIISTFTTGIITLIYFYLMRGVNIHETWPIALIFYIMLFSALVDFYDFKKNRKKRLARKIEYVRLLAEFLFVVTCVYNLFFI